MCEVHSGPGDDRLLESLCHPHAFLCGDGSQRDHPLLWATLWHPRITPVATVITSTLSIHHLLDVPSFSGWSPLVPPLEAVLSSRPINSNEPSLCISPSFFFVYHTEADRVLPHDLHRPCLVSSDVLLHSALMVVTGLGSPALCLLRLPWGLSGSPSTSQAYYLRSLSYQSRRYRGWRPTKNVYRNKQNTYSGFLSLTYLNELYDPHSCCIGKWNIL